MGDLSAVEVEVLGRVKEGFPLCSRPFEVIEGDLGIEGGEVVKVLQGLVDKGFVRRLGPIYSSRKLGYTVSSLVAVKVGEEFLEDVAGFVSSFPGVTHNYERKGSRYNLWFTLHAVDEERFEQVLEKIRGETGVEDIVSLPAKKVFKINMDLDIGDEES